MIRHFWIFPCSLCSTIGASNNINHPYHNVNQHVMSSFICPTFCPMSISRWCFYVSSVNISLSNSQRLPHMATISPRSTSLLSWNLSSPCIHGVSFIRLFVFRHQLSFHTVNAPIVSVSHCLSFNVKMPFCPSIIVSLIILIIIISWINYLWYLFRDGEINNQSSVTTN